MHSKRQPVKNKEPYTGTPPTTSEIRSMKIKLKIINRDGVNKMIIHFPNHTEAKK